MFLLVQWRESSRMDISDGNVTSELGPRDRLDTVRDRCGSDGNDGSRDAAGFPMPFPPSDEEPELAPFLKDTTSEVRSLLNAEQRVVIEGTQGYELSLPPRRKAAIGPKLRAATPARRASWRRPG